VPLLPPQAEVGDLPAEAAGTLPAKKSSTPPISAFCRSEPSNLLIYSLQSCFTVEGCDAELRRLKPWLGEHQSPGPACPVICVGTPRRHPAPSSGPNRDTIIANIRTRIETMIRRPGFPEIVEYVEVNAIRDNASVERLRTVIQSALEAFKVKGHHVMGQMVPESYVKLETLVMERARNTRQWYQLRKMATDAGLNMNDEKLSQAVRFLHESGVLLHFDDSTTAQQFYLRILEKFEIVLPQKNDELLIPCRLPDIAARDVTELAPVCGGIAVPLCPNGAYLLAQIADNIDVVIEEWYPGLTDRTVTGECILQKERPCVACCSRLNVNDASGAHNAPSGFIAASPA
uniref:COR domain-containing protein n=1 Tax=Macrostomum lignano TaxID=282301 RepID=A0A1I8FEG2_9PLAT